MPLDPASASVVTAMRNVPDFAHGLVRGVRVRWALEEIGRPYRAELYDGMQPRTNARGRLIWHGSQKQRLRQRRDG